MVLYSGIPKGVHGNIETALPRAQPMSWQEVPLTLSRGRTARVSFLTDIIRVTEYRPGFPVNEPINLCHQ